MKRPSYNHDCRARTGAWTLPELMVASALGVLILAVVSALTVYGLRSFTALGNYTDLDQKSRQALDQISKAVREATKLAEYDSNLPTRWLKFANTNSGVTTTITWDSTTRNLTTTSSNSSNSVTVTNLTEVEFWVFSLHQRTPLTNEINGFYSYPTPGGSSTCKQVDMTWKCSRAMLGKKWQTESVQTAKIVMRNAQ